MIVKKNGKKYRTELERSYLSCKDCAFALPIKKVVRISERLGKGKKKELREVLTGQTGCISPKTEPFCFCKRDHVVFIEEL